MLDDLKEIMKANQALLGSMLSKYFLAYSAEINRRFLNPIKQGVLLNVVKSIDDVYARLVVEYSWSEKVGPLISIQYAVSMDSKCWFPARTARYCAIIHLMESYPQLQGFFEKFRDIWYSDSWMLLGDTDGIKEANVQVIGDILQVGIPLFHEESKTLFGASETT